MEKNHRTESTRRYESLVDINEILHDQRSAIHKQNSIIKNQFRYYESGSF